MSDQPTNGLPAAAPNSVNPLPSGQDSKKTAFKKAKWGHFFAGFFGLYILNGIYLPLSIWLPSVLNISSDTQVTVFLISGSLCTLVNLGLIIGLCIIRKTRWIGFGILAAVAFGFILSILAGIFVAAICFTSTGSPY